MRPCNFYYNVSGEEAERLLYRYGSEGEFLARPSLSQPANYTLSVNRGSSAPITHVQIQNTNGCLNLVGQEFGTLPELIQHFIENPTELREKDGKTISMRRAVCIPLDEPAARDARGPTAERWFHANITGQEARQRLLKEKQWAYLVRESARSPGHYVISVKAAEGVVKHIMIERKPDSGMYHVHGGDEFRTIGDLLQHYNHNPMVEEDSQNVVHLRNMVCSSCLPSDAIDYRYRCLEQVDGSTKKDGIYEEFERIQKEDDQLFSKKEGKKEVNVKKNRYKNIVPYDHTRVVLKDLPDNESDYINANYIMIPKDNPLHLWSGRSYISTQGCLQHTVHDFLLMIWQNNSRVVVMTTKEVERARQKCYRYWPEVDGELCFDDITVKCTKEEKVKDRDEDSFIVRTLLISRRGETRSISHLQFVGWPDHGCPEHPDPVLKFLHVVDDTVRACGPACGPPVVHCSAGIGRTGTFIVIDVLINHIKEYGRSCTIDIPRTVLLIREQRSGMVQTEHQYRFVYKAIKAYINTTAPQRNGHFRFEDPLPLAPPPLPKRTRPDQVRSYVNNSHTVPRSHAPPISVQEVEGMRLG